MFVVPMMCMISSCVSSFPLAELVEWCTLEKNVQLVNVILEFLMSIGYGANKIATHVISVLHNTQKMMLERFDYLLERGAEYKMLCQIVSVFPKILIHGKEMLNEKLNYTSLWSWSLGDSFEYLDCFPALLCFDLENRVKRRMQCFGGSEYGLLKRPLAPATVLAKLREEVHFQPIQYASCSPK
jgi:hypothetical protein